MKKFLVTALLVFTSSLMANEYRTENGRCEFKVKESDMFNATEVELPFRFTLEYILSFERSANRYLGAKKRIVSQINSTSPVTEWELQEIADRINFRQSYPQGPVSVVMSLDSERVRNLVVYSGSYRAAYGDVVLPAINMSLNPGQCGRVQSHLSPNDNDGLSYHIEWCCVGKPGQGGGTQPPGQGGGTQPPGQSTGQSGGVCYQAGRRVPCPVYSGNTTRVCRNSNGVRVPCPNY